ncbi:MAG: rubredoxin [Pseudomonadota bacterium]
MKAYMCVICGFVYEEEKGRPEDGIPPGTRWEAVPENWKCPECGATKSDFEMIAI